MLDVLPGNEDVEAESGWDSDCDGEKPFSDIVGAFLINATVAEKTEELYQLFIAIWKGRSKMLGESAVSYLRCSAAEVIAGVDLGTAQGRPSRDQPSLSAVMRPTVIFVCSFCFTSRL